MYDVTISWIQSIVTGYDKTVIKHHLRYEISLPGTIQYQSGYDIRLLRSKQRCMATGYDTSALEYDTILFWLRYKVTKYDNTLFRLQYNITEYDITAYRVR